MKAKVSMHHQARRAFFEAGHYNVPAIVKVGPYGVLPLTHVKASLLQPHYPHTRLCQEDLNDVDMLIKK